MSDIPSFAKLVPGFDFLQGLVKNAGSALPSMGQWVAPTLNPEELQKRIDELKTVQFWLEQNAKMLGTTIQALEVQRMTLSTLKTMNVQMTDLREAMKITPASPLGSAASVGAESLMQAARTAMGAMGKATAAASAFEPASGAASAPASAPTPAPSAAEAATAADAANASDGEAQPAAATPGMVDPMQWWGALTKQFTQLAAGALKDTTADAATNLAGAMMKQGMEAAGETLKKAVAMPAEVAQQAQKAMSAATKATQDAVAPAAKKAAAAPAAAKPAARQPAARKKPTGAAKPAGKTRAS